MADVDQHGEPNCLIFHGNPLAELGTRLMFQERNAYVLMPWLDDANSRVERDGIGG